MPRKVFLISYVTKNKDVKSATLDDPSHQSENITPQAFDTYSRLVKEKNGDEIEYILNIQCLGSFGYSTELIYPY
ncbi:hypothetical protein [uncultured Acinetobacter sp.]|uniref:hypothetical protein n=1 Tax=uncultured Acinetobacter sp. TaxID=165433 RepID=UPI0025E5E7E0|nr:hypothetical protein [uncultured Acinetobacter sp.]